MQISRIETLLAGTGLIVRGGFAVEGDPAIPALKDGGKANSLLMIGNAGVQMWRNFIRAEEYRDGQANPMDRWTRRMIGQVAERTGATALYPFEGPPFMPFQRWAARCEFQSASPLGIMIHPDYGLWHALRGALLFDRLIEGIAANSGGETACDLCNDQPCLRTCPVDAYSEAGLNVQNCVAHLNSNPDCLASGCQARNACPQGLSFQYDTAEHLFHLEAFFRSNR